MAISLIGLIGFLLLNNIARNEYTLKSMNNVQVKIESNTPETYSAITKALMERDTKFHSYLST